MVQSSLNVQNVEGRVNLDPWILVLVVEYLFITMRGCVLSTIININRPDGSTYNQTVYVPKYLQHASIVSGLLEVNVLRSEHLIYHKNQYLFNLL